MVLFNKPKPELENHMWKVKVVNVPAGAYSFDSDPKVQEYIENYKYGIITPSSLYSELKDTMIVRSMTETQFAEFCSGLHKLGLELIITDLTTKQQ